MNQPLPVPHGTPLPSREAVSNQQFDTVLNVIRELQPYLLMTQREIELGIPRELDGGITSSAAATFIRACNRMDAMIDDASRWHLKENDALYEAMTKHFTSASENAQKQIETLIDTSRPSHQLKPTFTVVKGEYVAFWGTLALPGGMILGKGTTPEAALKDFDAAFLRDAANNLRFAPEAEERLKGLLAAPVKKKPKKGAL